MSVPREGFDDREAESDGADVDHRTAHAMVPFFRTRKSWFAKALALSNPAWVTSEAEGGPRRLAISAKGNQQVSASSLPFDFVTRAWEQSGQAECPAAPHGGRPEISTADLDSIATFMRLAPVSARRAIHDDAVRSGAELFRQAGCDACHVPAWRTGVVDELPLLSNQSIYPFTDLLLHHMGPGLADGRPDQAATGSEWRTPPLWGVGRVAELGVPQSFLHDGRARNLEEAVLWHGGEAAKARSAFVAWPQDKRETLIAFLKSL